MVEFLGQTAFYIVVEVVECRLKCGMPTSEKASFKILGRKVVNDIFQQTDDQPRCCLQDPFEFLFYGSATVPAPPNLLE
jgi:hypothetical protein